MTSIEALGGLGRQRFASLIAGLNVEVRRQTLAGPMQLNL
jgi:hypothetical protein